MLKKVLIFLICIVLYSSLGAAYTDCTEVPGTVLQGKTCVDVTSCTTSMQPDHYYLLTTDISSTGTCFNFNAYSASNVVFDLNKNAITFATGGSGHAFSFGGSTGPDMWVSNVEIKNGQIITGSTSLSWTAAINMWRSENIEIHDVEFHIGGSDNAGITGCSNCRGINEIHNNNFIMNTTTGDACSHFQIAGAINFHQHSGALNIYNNNFSGKGMKGISVSDCQANPDPLMNIYNNRIEMWSWKRDGYAIAVEGLNGACSAGTTIYDNYINQSSGRGIVVAGWNVPTDNGPHNFDIYNNYIEVQEGASCEGGHNGNAYGLRIRFGAGNISFHENTIIGHGGAGLTEDTTNGANDGSDIFGIKVGGSSPYGRNVSIYNNNISVNSNAKTNKQGGWIQARGLDSGIAFSGSPILLSNNRISSNEILITLGAPDYGSHQYFTSNTFIKSNDLYGSDFKTIQINNQWDVVDVQFLDTLTMGGADIHDIIFVGSDSGNKNINISWYLTVNVDANGPAEGATITIESLGPHTYTATGITDANGQIVFTLPDTVYLTRTPRTANPYNVTVTYGGETQSQEVILNSSKQVNIQFTDIDCKTPYDLPPCNCIQQNEVVNSILGWYTDAITELELISNINQWKNGC